MTTVLDGAGEGSAKASWVLMRRSKKRTALGPQVHGPKSSWIQAAASCGSKKPDRYWSAPARPERRHPPRAHRAFRSAKSCAPSGCAPAPLRLLGEARQAPRTRSHRPGRPSPRRDGRPAMTITRIRFDPRPAARIDDHGYRTALARTAPTLVGRKNRTGIGPHPPAPGPAENPVISVAEAGYVRSSESNLAVACNSLSGLDNSGPTHLHEPDPATDCGQPLMCLIT